MFRFTSVLKRSELLHECRCDVFREIARAACAEVDSKESFDTPFLATSLSDFWRRWNRFAGLLLKDICLDPIMEGRLVCSRGECGVPLYARMPS